MESSFILNKSLTSLLSTFRNLTPNLQKKKNRNRIATFYCDAGSCRTPQQLLGRQAPNSPSNERPLLESDHGHELPPPAADGSAFARPRERPLLPSPESGGEALHSLSRLDPIQPQRRPTGDDDDTVAATGSGPVVGVSGGSPDSWSATVKDSRLMNKNCFDL